MRRVSHHMTFQDWSDCFSAVKIPTLVLQRAFYHPGVIGPQDLVAMVLYFMHFVLPIVVGFVFWVNSREHYWHFVARCSSCASLPS